MNCGSSGRSETLPDLVDHMIVCVLSEWTLISLLIYQYTLYLYDNVQCASFVKS